MPIRVELSTINIIPLDNQRNLQFTHLIPTFNVSSAEAMICREGCGACCIAPSISSSIPNQLEGKKAGISCVQLDDDMRCKIFTSSLRPSVCASLKASREMCGDHRQHAMDYLTQLEKITS